MIAHPRREVSSRGERRGTKTNDVAAAAAEEEEESRVIQANRWKWKRERERDAVSDDEAKVEAAETKLVSHMCRRRRRRRRRRRHQTFRGWRRWEKTPFSMGSDSDCIGCMKRK